MARKKKNQLPSGNVRIQVFDYTDVDGKKHYKSFTAPTRQEAKYLAVQWKAGKAEKKPARITLFEDVGRYIDAKEGVLSPSTIRAYRKMHECRMKDIGRVWLDELNSTDVQIWISDLYYARHWSARPIYPPARGMVQRQYHEVCIPKCH